MRIFLLIVLILFSPLFYVDGSNGIIEKDSISEKQIVTSKTDALSGFGERVLDLLTWQRDNKVVVIYPAGGYSSRTGLEAGIMPVYSWKNNSDNGRPTGRPNTLMATIQLSTNGMVELRSELDWFSSAAWQIRLKTDFVKINDRLWLPSDFDSSDEGIKYESRRLGGAIQLLYGISGKLNAGATLQIYNFTFRQWPNELNLKSVEGLKGGLVFGIGPVLMFDSRDHILYPRRGNYLSCAAVINAPLFGGDYQFSNYMVDLRNFISLQNKVVASQLLWEYAPNDVPFFMLPKLGGKERLRGIGHSQRIVNNSVWLARSELRFPLWWRFGAVAFVGLGQASEMPLFNLNEIIYSGGAGLRFRILPDEPLNIRLDAGLASHGLSGFFISLKEAF
jgi:outer membrane protein assembly factor BamA